MKKIFAIAAVAAMLIACGEPEENKPQGGNNNGGNTEQGGNENQEPEVPALAITIDGDFADWEALDASKVASATLPAGAAKGGLKEMKACSDENYLYIYAEYDPAVITSYDWTVIDLYLNLDGDETTGGGNDHFGAPYCSDYLVQGPILSAGAYDDYSGWALALFPRAAWAEAGATGWYWSCLDEGVEGTSDNNWGALIPEGQDLGSVAGSGAKFEIGILKILINEGEWADTFSIGLDIDFAWGDVEGFLPQAPATEENTGGEAGLLTVTTVK